MVQPVVKVRAMFGVASAVFSLLLIGTGVAKLRNPSFTGSALAALGISWGTRIAVVLGVTEVVVGVGAVVGVSVWAAVAQSILYASFFVWVAYALRTGAPLETCGCLGRDDTPPYWGHLAVNGLGVVVSVGYVATFESAVDWSGVGLIAGGLVAAAGAVFAWWIIGDASRVIGRVQST